MVALLQVDELVPGDAVELATQSGYRLVAIGALGFIGPIITTPTSVIVDPVNGHDTTPAGPFKTIARTNAYLQNAIILGTTLTVHLAGDIPPGDAQLGFAFTALQGGQVLVTGTVHVLATSVITAATTSALPNTNRRAVVDDKVLGANNGWTNFVGAQIVCTAGAHNGTHATIVSNPASSSAFPAGGLAGYVNVTNGSAAISFFKNLNEPATTIPQTLAAGTTIGLAIFGFTQVTNGSSTITFNFPGTANVTNGSPNISFSQPQTIPTNQPLIFASQPGTTYFLSAAISNATVATLSANYTGVSNAGTACAAAQTISNTQPIIFGSQLGPPQQYFLTASIAGATSATLTTNYTGTGNNATSTYVIYTIQNDVIGATSATLTTAYAAITDSTHSAIFVSGSTANISQPISVAGGYTGAGGVLSNGDAYQVQKGSNVVLGNFSITTDSSTAVLTFQFLNFVARSDGFSFALSFGKFLFQQCSFPARITAFQSLVQCQDCYIAAGATFPLSTLRVDAGTMTSISAPAPNPSDSGQQLIGTANAYFTGSSVFVAPGLLRWESFSAGHGLNGAQGVQFQDCDDQTGQAGLVLHTAVLGVGANFSGLGGAKIWGNNNFGCGITLYYLGQLAVTSAAAFTPTITGQTGDVNFDNPHQGGFTQTAYAWDPTTQLYTAIRLFTWTLWAAAIAASGFNYHAHKTDIGAQLIGI